MAERSLPVTGRKDELIARLLTASASSDDQPTLDSTGAAAAIDEPDSDLGLSGTGMATQAVTSTETDRDAQHADEGLKTGTTTAGGDEGAPAAAGEVGQNDDDKAAEEAIRIEMEKRKARAAKFGTAEPALSSTAATTSKKEPAGGAVEDSEEVKRKRAERFGTTLPAAAATDGETKKPEGNEQQNGDAKVKKVRQRALACRNIVAWYLLQTTADNCTLSKPSTAQSLALLDSALGSNRRPKSDSNKQQKPAPSSKSSAPANGGGVTNAAQKGGKISAGEAAAEPAAAVAADPELQKRCVSLLLPELCAIRKVKILS